MTEGAGKIVVDASVLAPLILLSGRQLLSKLRRHRVAMLDLTVYEACNAYWKACLKLKSISEENALKASTATLIAARACEIHRFDELDLKEVERIALNTGTTFYDASYLVLAKTLKAKLATEDRDLLKEAPRHGVDTLRLEELTETLNLKLLNKP